MKPTKEALSTLPCFQQETKVEKITKEDFTSFLKKNKFSKIKFKGKEVWFRQLPSANFMYIVFLGGDCEAGCLSNERPEFGGYSGGNRVTFKKAKEFMEDIISRVY